MKKYKVYIYDPDDVPIALIRLSESDYNRFKECFIYGNS